VAPDHAGEGLDVAGEGALHDLAVRRLDEVVDLRGVGAPQPFGRERECGV
jgi:hypothetical protein